MGVGLFAAGSDAGAATPCGSTGSFGSPSSCSYTAIGKDSFTVPLGVTSMELVADGAAGGLLGGHGAQVTADIPVNPGDTEYVEVGVGGGAGGSGFITRAGLADGGFGGGLSGLYSCPSGATNSSCALVVAGGGGGGGGGGGSASNGGDGGAGGLFCNAGTGAAVSAGGGGGGGCSAGGSAGLDVQVPTVDGNAGSAGSGGAGGYGANAYGACALGGNCLFGGGGGGGGGYYGGGGSAGSTGGAGDGGGGGSSFAETSASDVSMTSDSGTPSVTITWASQSDGYSYNANGGTGTAPASGSGPDGTPITLAANTFSNPGYTFAGWSDGSATYAAGGSYTLSSGARPIVFVAQWSDGPSDTVAFNSDGGTAISSIAGPDGGSIALPSDTYPGYTFLGWFTRANGGSEVGGAGSSYAVPTGGASLYAQWSQNPVETVAFNADGGAAVSSFSGPSGSSITLPSDVNPGFSLDGWFTASSGGNEVGDVGWSYVVPLGGATLYAQWTQNSIETVRFYSDGGAAVPSQSGPGGSSITLPSDTYPDHLFDGWFTKATGGSPVGGAGSPFTFPPHGTTLYARWTGITKFSPTSGPVGTVVSIQGTELLGATEVTFNGVEGKIIRNSAGTIKVKVPVGATKGLIIVTTPGGSVASARKFKVT